MPGGFQGVKAQVTKANSSGVCCRSARNEIDPAHDDQEIGQLASVGSRARQWSGRAHAASSRAAMN
jgi:hypothetical protein